MITAAARDVLAERERQQKVEGWNTTHDDDHDGGTLCAVAAHYAIDAACKLSPYDGTPDYDPFNSTLYWPWDRKWWKPGEPRRNLVKAAALILAEIERIDRLAGKAP